MSSAVDTGGDVAGKDLATTDFALEDMAAATSLKIRWRQKPGRNPWQKAKKYHSERVCREAVSRGIIREVMGHNPKSMCIRAGSHSRTWEISSRSFVGDQAHMTVGIERESVHIYLSPNDNCTGASHFVTHVTRMKAGVSSGAAVTG